MIDSTTETILTFIQAAEELPRRRRGRKTHVSTFYRWADPGCRGVRLETIQVGGTCCTSREALQRFFEALTAARSRVGGPDQAGSTPPPLRRTTARQLRDSDRAGRELERQGA
jgi:hypothetical protein